MSETVNGKLTVASETGNDVEIILNAGTNSRLGPKGTSPGKIIAASPYIQVKETDGKTLFEVNKSGNLYLGGANNQGGDIRLKDANGKSRIILDAKNNRIQIFDSNGTQIVELGPNGNLVLGGGSYDGDITLKTADGDSTITMNADNAEMFLGGSGINGNIEIFASDDVKTVSIDGANGNITLGGDGHDGDLMLNNAEGNQTIHLNGDTGDIILSNADVAEDFDVISKVDVLPGMLMVMSPVGALFPCDKAYDSRVMGVVSGAGKYKPGIIMDKQESSENRSPIAMMGKVEVMVDASYGSIIPGDMLTSSPTPGHAMIATDREKAFGAVVGKALTGLDAGCGFVQMMISLQ